MVAREQWITNGLPVRASISTPVLPTVLAVAVTCTACLLSSSARSTLHSVVYKHGRVSGGRRIFTCMGGEAYAVTELSGQQRFGNCM